MADFKRTRLHLIFRQEEEATRHHSKSISLQKSGHWRDAADELVECARILKGRLLNLPVQSACFYAKAAEIYTKVDKTEALKIYLIAIEMYCELAKFVVAGQLERAVALVHFQNKHFEEAALHYRKAADFLSGERQIEQSDLCMERAADCLVRIGESMSACKMLEQIAKSCTQSNLRKFNARSYLMKAIIFMLGMKIEITVDETVTIMKNEAKHFMNERAKRLQAAKEKRANEKKNNKEMASLSEEERSSFLSEQSAATGDAPITGSSSGSGYQRPRTVSQRKYDEITHMFNSYDSLDLMWRGSTEKKFIFNVLKARLNNDEYTFIDHCYYYNCVRPFDKYSLEALKVAFEEIPTELTVSKIRLDMQAKFDEEERIRSLEEAAGGGFSSGTGSTISETPRNSSVNASTNDDSVNKSINQ